ncbi:MAG: family 16 glycoside hydrolase [Isosphaeraceae bacterium]
MRQSARSYRLDNPHRRRLHALGDTHTMASFSHARSLWLRVALTVSVAALSLAVGAAAPPKADELVDYKPIFNGKDLTGWDGNPELWSVKDGAITGTTSTEKPLKYNQFLIYRGASPRNFALKARVRVVGDNNSGIQYRSKELPQVGKYSVGGYQADMHPSPNYNGMLYDERGRGIVAEAGQKVIIGTDGKKHTFKLGEPSKVDLSEWHTYEVIASGNHLVHKLDGKTTVEVYDHQESERELEGLIAIQVHAGPKMMVQVKEIALATLPEVPLTRPEDTPVNGGVVPPAKAKAKGQAKAKGKRQVPSGPAPETARAEALKPPAGFKVELVHTVARETQGSWVSMTLDPKGRLIVSDQYGKLYRVTPSPIGAPASQTKVEPIAVNIGGAHGLLWAFDSLYVMNNEAQGGERGLYRVRDTNGDDQLDKVELLRGLNGGGEHGPHAIVQSPDGKSLYVVAGNATQLPKVDGSLVPRIWGEDNLNPHMPDGAGFMTTEKAPGGWICRVDPDGKTWELVSMGYRNPYDIAFNRAGELFTYDSDMEWDMNLPWYRPTRVCQAVSGSDFGYRNGSGKWPTYYFDSLPPVTDIGPGSPTGITFGYGAKFPARYQEALFISDWSYGKLYAIHLKPKGAAYTADVEEFVQGTPLPLTDLTVRPQDGALYFAIGGRRTSSGLYRIVYSGPESTAPIAEKAEIDPLVTLRRQLESFHGHQDPKAVDAAWPHLGHPDRFVAYAARVAIEFQPVDSWRDRALNEGDPAKAIPALLALTRVSAQDPAHRPSGAPAPSTELRDQILESLGRIDLAGLSEQRLLDVLRVGEVLLVRFGVPDQGASSQILDRLRPLFPARSQALNRELAQIFVALDAPDAAEKIVGLLTRAPSQEEQITYATILRGLKSGWTPELRRTYFAWIAKASGYKGGNSFNGFLRTIRTESLSHLGEAARKEVQSLLDARTESLANAVAAKPRPHVKNWTLDELVPLVENGMHGRDYDRGRTLFGAASCFACHRFNNEGGGAGPELTGLAGRFTPRDLLESIVVPSKVISDQYGAVMIATKDGTVVTGRIVNLAGDSISVSTNMLEPNNQTRVDRNAIEEIKPSPVSMMPEGLLNTLNKEEVLDLMAYLLSRGDRNAPVFKKP